MRWMPLLVLAAACGAPLEEDEATVEVTTSLSSLRVQLGDAVCHGACRIAAPPRDVRLPLKVSGDLELQRDVWLPARGELVKLDVSASGVELNVIDENAPPGLSLDGLDVVNFSDKPVLAYGGCALHEVQPGSSAALDCVNDGLVALQQSEAAADRVKLTTTYGLWAD